MQQLLQLSNHIRCIKYFITINVKLKKKKKPGLLPKDKLHHRKILGNPEVLGLDTPTSPSLKDFPCSTCLELFAVSISSRQASRGREISIHACGVTDCGETDRDGAESSLS